MDTFLKGMLTIKVFVYLDVIVLNSRNLEEHAKKVRRFFTRLQEAKLKLPLEKYDLLRP